ncbi:Electrogenic sodium bicarbonate cotransporter 4 [Labeo rohita]|uniref:Electrogenic sodium bicarbonate cotransporter 4 n=1 Tax=Labeo rohita TaxID=84645 RepID=A0ABQ8MBL1_LABRO|nr:Electrogenic sodium bicarbonate cotransporter 4 [Labeo rohita]
MKQEQRRSTGSFSIQDSIQSLTSSLGSQSTQLSRCTVSPAAERLRHILREEDEPTPTLFTEMDTLQHEGGEMEWKESARWVKFEEKVEEGGERWSKPHVSTLSLHSLFELRTCLQTGCILLDLEGYSLPQIVDDIIEKQVQEGLIAPEIREKISFVLLRKHRHQTKKPIHRSLADIGKPNTSNRSPSPSSRSGSGFHRSTEDLRARQSGGLSKLRFSLCCLVPVAKPSPTMKSAAPWLRSWLTMKSVFSLNELGQPNGNAGGGAASAEDEAMPAPHELGEELKFTGRFCGGLWLDIKRKVPWILSDFYEGFHIQSISAVLFIYLGCITNAITFGGLLGDATDNYQKKIKKRLSYGLTFLGTALAGAVFCLFGGQPLIILSSTGPILIFEKLLYEFSINNDIDYMEIRLWIGLHSCLQCLILVATDASYIIKYMTRFTEEGFSSLISFIFISDALKKMMSIFNYYPISPDFKPEYITSYRCDCQAPDQGLENMSDYSMFNFSALDWNELSKKECLRFGGSLVGKSCKYVPDLAMLSFILFFGTYSMTISLKKFKASRYFPTKCRTLIADFAIIVSILVFCAVDYVLSLDTPKLHVPTQIKLRKLISDFAIFTSIMTFVGLDMLMGLKTPKLIVPTEFKPTRPDRGWIVMPFGKNPWWMCLASFVPALLVTILIFMDQQITAVIVNRKENKLKKGCGYHLDLFWVGILMAICSFMGLPWYVAATVISIAHIDSLKMESESSAPGEQPQFLGVREQRLTGILVFVLTGVSVFLAPILQYIPMPVLYGVFLYMGVASLHGIQFWERMKLFLMPAKHQPDFVFLRHVPLRRVHLFTLVQITCLAVLWILKSTVAAIIFPVMILGLMVVRKMLDLIFSQHDLAWLDDVLPDKDKKKKEDEKKKKEKKKAKSEEHNNSDEEEYHPYSCTPGDSNLDLDRMTSLT